MARYTVSHPLVRGLIEDMLIPAYVAEGNTAALTRVINEILADVGIDSRLHVNRVHALLSDDVARGVNQSTVDLLKIAAGAERWPAEVDDDKISELRNRAAPHLNSGMELAAVSELIGVPPAVLARVIAGTRAAPEAVTIPASGPDWSFQDVAVERCMAAFRRKASINIGLVLPTGAGKTRTALRVVLEQLAANPDGEARAIWVTHRHNLKAQAFRELGKLVDQNPPGLPDDAADLAERIDFAMLSEVPALLARTTATAIIIVDEAHHAAAPSYGEVFAKKRPYPVLLLTATPVRMDAKPIFIDEIAFTITYRELAERRAIIVPEFEPLKVRSLELSDPEVVDQIARRIVDETRSRFRKTLVIASRIEYVEALHARVIALLDDEVDHPIDLADVGFLHGRGNSHGLGAEAMLALFADKPHAILLSAQMLLEGFDDPAIDSVVITYRTDSVISLMQAAGRCVRHAPGKRRAWVVQVDNPALAYRFDQRWLYEDISDRPRPILVDLDYGSREELERGMREQLDLHHVAPDNARRVLAALGDVDLEDQPRLMLYGLPYFGIAAKFDEAPWGAFLETKGNTKLFRGLFNRYCQVAERPDASEFVKEVGPGLGLPASAGRLRRDLIEVIGALGFALDEVDDKLGPAFALRNYAKHGATTFLRYVISRYHDSVPPELTAFLADCHNGLSIAATYSEDPEEMTLAIKVPLPIGGFEARLLSTEEADLLIDWLDTLASVLRGVEPARQLARLTTLRSEIPAPPLPPLHLDRTEAMIAEAGRQKLTLNLRTLQEQKR
ncbi:DEAD/DEAH box helicase [Sphingomonas sp.]|jgi:superfamily II DNA or RNA helicase|uniref:DEAD/DEAH box helicase n=1 Tax=Sphingomonas sp. TaxID=28214 RepID=UPI002E2FCDCA|nr:DEAD/DEAH box helicase family protein [Sphingomonas sp.]HEX4694478.1 DEAD/DEAH box helicase family protein [Sphingomonas sp.]